MSITRVKMTRMARIARMARTSVKMVSTSNKGGYIRKMHYLEYNMPCHW